MGHAHAVAPATTACDPGRCAGRDDEQFTVLRLTLGIPGFDEAELPKWIAGLCLALLAVNHLAGSGAVSAAQVCCTRPRPARAAARPGALAQSGCLQTRTELLGGALAAACIAAPGLGGRLKAAQRAAQGERSALRPEQGRVLLLAEDAPDALKQVQPLVCLCSGARGDLTDGGSRSWPGPPTR